MGGYLATILSSFFLAIYVIPRKYVEQEPVFSYAFWLVIGYFPCCLITYLLHPETLLRPVLWWSIPASVLAGIGFVTAILAVDKSGVIRYGQWKSLQGPISILLGLTLLSEYRQVKSGLLLCAMTFMLLGVFVFSSAHPRLKEINRMEKRLRGSGTFYSIIAISAFALYGVIQKYMTLYAGVYSQQLLIGIINVLIFTITAIGTHTPLKFSHKSYYYLPILAGLFQFGTNYTRLLGYAALPAVIVFTVIELSSAWSTGIGIIFFRELSFRKEWPKIFLGTICSLSGVYLAFLSL